MKNRIKNQESRIVGLFVTLFMLHASLFMIQPVYAVDIESTYGYGYLKTLGQGTNKLVLPTFSIAMAVVIFYFLVGAFKILISAGDKEAEAAARGMITHAIIGFIILMFAFLILQFVPQFFGFNFSIF